MQIIRNVLANEIYEIIQEFNISYIIYYIINTNLKSLLFPKIPFIFYINFLSLY